MTALRISKHNKNRSFGGVMKWLGCLVLAGGIALVVVPAEAANVAPPDGKAVKIALNTKTEVAVKDREETGSIEVSSDGLSCSQARRKLFVEGEGWIVRKVTTCY